MNKDKIKGLIQVLIDAECISDVNDEAALDGFEIGYLYATNSDFKLFADECIEIYSRFDETLKETDNVGVAQNALGFYFIEVSQSNIKDRYNEFIRQLYNKPITTE